MYAVVSGYIVGEATKKEYATAEIRYWEGLVVDTRDIFLFNQACSRISPLFVVNVYIANNLTSPIEGYGTNESVSVWLW